MRDDGVLDRPARTEQQRDRADRDVRSRHPPDRDEPPDLRVGGDPPRELDQAPAVSTDRRRRVQPRRRAQLGRELLRRPEPGGDVPAALRRGLDEGCTDVGEKVVALLGRQVGERRADRSEVHSHFRGNTVHAVTSASVWSRSVSTREKSAHTSRASASWARPRSVMP